MALAYLVKIIDGPPVRFYRIYESYQESALPKGKNFASVEECKILYARLDHVSPSFSISMFFE